MMEYNLTFLKPFGALLEPKTINRISDLRVEVLRQLVEQEQLIILRGFASFNNSLDFAHYCASWGEISLWPFGKVLELVEQDKPEDHIFANGYIPLHWDGMYRPEIPELQIFHCVAAPLSGQGGRTTFSNTLLVLEQASTETKALWHRVTATYQRKMEFYNSTVSSPILTKHPYQNFSVIRYNEPPTDYEGSFINPSIMEFRGITDEELPTFHLSLKNALYQANSFYAHEWQQGDVVIADNFSLLHGRESFIAKSPRHLRRVHILSNPPFANPGLEYYQ